MIKKKRLVAVFWDLGIGGIQTRLREIVKEVERRGFEVTVLIERRSPQEVLIDGRAKILNFRDDKYEELKRPFRRLERFRFLGWIILKTWQEKPSVVLAFLNRFSVFMVIIKKLFGLVGRQFRLVINEGILTSRYLNQFESKKWWWLVRWAYPRSDLIIVPTMAVRDDLRKKFGVTEEKIEVVNSWVSGIKMGKEKIYEGVFVGRLSPEKGVDKILELARGMKIAVIGDGVLRQQVKKNKMVKYLGYLNNNEVKKIIGQSEVLLLPSKNEGMPMVILEAYVLGVPVVVTPFMGVEEVVDNGVTGKIFSRKTYVEETLKLIRKKDQLQLMGRCAQELAKNKFSGKNLKVFVEQLVKNVA